MSLKQAAFIFLCVGIAFQIGHMRGQASCPMAAQATQDRLAAIDRDVAALLAMPSDREAICDQVFHLVRDGLDRESLDEQAERARVPAD